MKPIRFILYKIAFLAPFLSLVPAQETQASLQSSVDVYHPSMQEASIISGIVEDPKLEDNSDQEEEKENYPTLSNDRLKSRLDLLSPTQSTQLPIHSDDKITQPFNNQATQPVLKTSLDPDVRHHPLPCPDHILWQGWVDMAAYGDRLQERYVIVTIEGLLYTLQDRPLLYTTRHIPIGHTINLAKYGFVLPIDVDKPDSFVLAKVNPANTKLTADNTFTLDTPITDTLKDELISYVKQNNVDVSDFLAWLADEEMDEEALIADITIPAQSNIRKEFSALYQDISKGLYQLISTYPYQDISTGMEKVHPKEPNPPHLNALIGQDQEGTAIASPLLYALRIPHDYVYVDAQDDAIYPLDRDTTLAEDKDQDKAQQEKASKDTPTPATSATGTPQRQRDLNPLHRRPLRSRKGSTQHTASATQRGLTIDTAHYHLVPLVHQIERDHTPVTYYCLVPPSYKTTYQNFVEMMTTYQGMPVQRLNYLHQKEAQDLRYQDADIDWHIAKQKALFVHLGLARYFLQSPNRILWKGWVYMTQNSKEPKLTYLFVTDDDICYTFSKKVSLHHPNPIEVTATIDLSHHTFVAPINEKSKDFTLASTDAAMLSEKNLSSDIFCFYPDNAIPQHPLHPDTIDTLQDELILYLIQEGVSPQKIIQLMDWLKEEEMDEEALIQYIRDENKDELASNLKKDLLAILPSLCSFVQHQTRPNAKNELTEQEPKNFRYRQDDDLSTLLTRLRLGIRQYYYIDNTLRRHTIHALHDDEQAYDNKAHGTDSYSIGRVICQTQTEQQQGIQNNQTALLYCLVPPTYPSTYQEFATLLRDYLGVARITLTHYDKDTALENNQSDLYWNTKEDKIFKAILPPTIEKEALCHVEAQEEDTDTSRVKTTCPHLKENKKDGNIEYDALLCPIYQKLSQQYIHVSNADVFSDAFKNALFAYLENENTSKTEIEDCKVFLRHKKKQAIIKNLKRIVKSSAIARYSHSIYRKAKLHLAQQKENTSKSEIEDCKIFLRHKKKQAIIKDLKKDIDSSAIAQYSRSMYDKAKLYLAQLKEDLTHLAKYSHGSKRPCPLRKCAVLQKWTKYEKLDEDEKWHFDTFFDHTTEQRRELKTKGKSGENLFSFNAEFGKMNRLNLWALDPLQQLQDPRLLLKKLLQEVSKNGCSTDIPEKTDWSHIYSTKYVTPQECPWLTTVSSFVNSNRGKPLNIAEMAAIKLYTDSTKAYGDLGWAQRSGKLGKWEVWDQLLMSALLKLHLAELASGKRRTDTYSGLSDIKFYGAKKGFFTTYVSTSKYKSTAQRFIEAEGMMMYISPAMQREFINADVSWISTFPQEEEILFARSADIPFYPAPKWKATLEGELVEDVQKVVFEPAADPLVVPKNTTKELSAAASYEFSYINLREGATLTVKAWNYWNREGGSLSIRCYGDCILEKGAKIVLNAKGYSGGDRYHPQGYGKYRLLESRRFVSTGGHGGSYCAGGGSLTSQGSSGQCQDAFNSKKYHASSGTCHHACIAHKNDMRLGSGGGYIDCADAFTTDNELQKGAQGASGGGALYVEIDGNLQLAEETAFLANGGDAHKLTGGAGSGGTICIAVKGTLDIADNATLRAEAMGGSHEDAIHPSAQGAGGVGQIVFYLNESILDKEEQLHTKWARQCITNPPALLLPRGTSAWKAYESGLRKGMEAYKVAGITLHRTIEITMLAYVLGTFTQVDAQLRQKASATDGTPKIPHHVTITGTYCNAQGQYCAQAARYERAIQYHEQALKLQDRKYKAEHPEKAHTLACLSKIAMSKGAYAQALAKAEEALKINETSYGSQDPAHPAIIASHNLVGRMYHAQGKATEAQKQLEETLQLWQTHHQEKEDRELIDTYNHMGLVQQSLGQYEKAIKEYHTKAQAIAEKIDSSKKEHPTMATTLSYIGQAQTSLGQYDQAIATHQQAIKLLNHIYKRNAHPHKARSLRGEAMAYLEQAQLEVALQQYQQALNQLREVYGQDAIHPDIAATLSGMALVRSEQQYYALANTLYQEALTMHQQIYGSDVDHPDIAENLEGLGEVALHQQQGAKATGDSQEAKQCYQEAMEYYKKALTIKEKLYGTATDHPAIAQSHAHIGRALLANQQHKEALAAQEKALEMAEKIYGRSASIPTIAALYYQKGLVHQAMEHHEQAQAAYEIAFKIYKAIFGDKPHLDKADAHHALAGAYGAQSLYEKAKNHSKEALEMRKKVYRKVPYHPVVNDSLCQMGDICTALGQYEEAMDHYVQAITGLEHTREQYPHTEARIRLQMEKSLPTLMSRVQEDDKHYLRLLCLMGELDSQTYLNRLYLPPQATQNGPVHEQVMACIHSSSPLLLLMGDAGTGKSTYSAYLMKTLCKAYQGKEKNIIPFFISLLPIVRISKPSLMISSPQLCVVKG